MNQEKGHLLLSSKVPLVHAYPGRLALVEEGWQLSESTPLDAAHKETALLLGNGKDPSWRGRPLILTNSTRLTLAWATTSTGPAVPWARLTILSSADQARCTKSANLPLPVVGNGPDLAPWPLASWMARLHLSYAQTFSVTQAYLLKFLISRMSSCALPLASMAVYRVQRSGEEKTSQRSALKKRWAKPLLWQMTPALKGTSRCPKKTAGNVVLYNSSIPKQVDQHGCFGLGLKLRAKKK